MQVIQSPRFKRVYKKLKPNQIKPVNDAIKEIMADPGIGEQKQGDLDWLRVYKFEIHNLLTLLGYTVTKTHDDTDLPPKKHTSFKVSKKMLNRNRENGNGEKDFYGGTNHCKVTRNRDFM